MEKELTKESVNDILVRCITVGQSKGAYSIKDASFLYKVITQIKEDKGIIKENYDALVRAVVVANSKGAYTLEEAALIERVVNFLDKEGMITTDNASSTKEV